MLLGPSVLRLEPQNSTLPRLGELKSNPWEQPLANDSQELTYKYLNSFAPQVG